MSVNSSMTQYQLRRYFYQKAASELTPLSGTFELTPRCNMNCRMCYIRMSESEMRAHGREHSAEEWIELGKKCADHGTLFLLFTGGEPFLRKDFREIYTELKKLGLMISINTNATLIDEETVHWLSENAPSKISVTLYGGSNETYARLCGHPHGFDAATRAIDMMKEAGLLVHINSSFTRYNVADIAAIAQFAHSRELRVSSATYMFPPVRNSRDGICDEAVRFTPEESGIARAEADLLMLPPLQLRYRLELLRNGLIDSEKEDSDCERTTDQKMGCMAGRASFWVTWDGRMTPCGMMNVPTAYPFETGFEKAWQIITNETDKLTLPNACSNCHMRKFCMVCGALCMAENGRTNIKPEYLCKQTAAYIARMEQARQQLYGGEP